MADIVTKIVTIKRTSLWSIGVKNWYVFQDTDGITYQRWSFLMDDTDEALMLLRENDVVKVSFETSTHPSGSPRNVVVGLVQQTL